MSLKKKSLAFLIFSTFLLSWTGISCAQAFIQTGTLEIIAPETVISGEPADFYFPISFIPETGILSTYVTLHPANPDGILQIYDSNDTSGFRITIASTDLNSITGTGYLIHYTNLALVTLSLDPGGVDTASYNIPPGTANVVPYLKCPWDPSSPDTIASQCDAYMTPFPELPGGSTTSGQLSLLENMIAADTGAYWVGFGFRLNITPEMRQDFYTGTIIFTLIPI